MLHLDHALLERAGLGDLPLAEKDAYLKAFRERLEIAVGRRLAERMTDEQLDDFERLIGGSEALALVWLHVHFPEYRQVTREEFHRLSGELAEHADQILILETTFARS